MTNGPAAGMLSFIDASPTPFHAADRAAAMLRSADFTELDASKDWPVGSTAGNGFVMRDGALVAWGRDHAGPAGPLRLIGAHTDSPNLRIRPRPDRGGAGFRQLAVEVYGGALVNSWLDRDLGLAGRVALRTDGGVRHRLFRTDGPILRVPQLAIHLDPEVADRGLLLNPQQHLTPVWGLGDPTEGDFRRWLATLVDAPVDDVLAWEAMCFDDAPSAVFGVDRDLLAAPRLDDQCSCFGGIAALVATTQGGAPTVAATPVVVLHDHEEVGSTSVTGAAGTWLAQVLERRVLAIGGQRGDLLCSLATSLFLSADMAHGTHPNYPERHEPGHHVVVGGGPVIKHNVNERYATDSRGAATFRVAAAAAGVDVQDYSHRGDMRCGSTIGPLSAAGLAVDTVDVGMAQLSMHSAREMMAVADVGSMVAAFGAWLSPA